MVTSILFEKFILNSDFTIILPIMRIKNTVENTDWIFMKLADQSYFVKIVLIMHNKCSQADIASTHSSGKLWCHCTQWDLARHPKQASTYRSFHTWLQSFSCRQTNSIRMGRWINHVCQEYIDPNRKKVVGYLPAQGKLFKLTSIPKMQYNWNLY